MRRQHAYIAAAAAALILIVLTCTSANLRAKARAQLEVSAGAGDDGPVQMSLGAPALNTGITPGRYPVHIPRFAHMGPHRMYRHPGTCSPGLGAPVRYDYAWRFSPPSEGDL